MNVFSGVADGIFVDTSQEFPKGMIFFNTFKNTLKSGLVFSGNSDIKNDYHVFNALYNFWDDKKGPKITDEAN